MSIMYMECPLGYIKVTGDGTAITGCSFTKKREKDIPDGICEMAVAQLHEYFAKRRKVFTLPLHMEGTPFQKQVWEALCTIPYGETRSYGQIAKQIGHPQAYRAVGMANNRNPLAIIVPCHRIIGSDGKLVGYGGGLEKKRFLLELEKQ